MSGVAARWAWRSPETERAPNPVVRVILPWPSELGPAGADCPATFVELNTWADAHVDAPDGWRVISAIPLPRGVLVVRFVRADFRPHDRPDVFSVDAVPACTPEGTAAALFPPPPAG